MGDGGRGTGLAAGWEAEEQLEVAGAGSGRPGGEGAGPRRRRRRAASPPLGLPPDLCLLCREWGR